MTRLAGGGQRWCGLTVLLLLTAFLGGCGGGLCPVEGQVVWKDGTPAKELEGSLVIFDLPEKQFSAQGVIQAEGHFRLTTNKPNDGALPGEYKVLIVEVGRKPLPGDATTLAPGVIDARYSNSSTSDLKATVKPDGGKITLTVERAPRP